MHASGHPNLRRLVALVAVAGVLAGGWSVLRDSDWVAVQEVEVTGASGSQAEAIRSALTTAGRDMTTLHVRPEVLKTSVAPYAAVKDVNAEADLPHGLRVRVTEHVPVAKVVTPQGGVPVAADGTVLRGTTADDVAQLKLRIPPAGDRITDARTLQTIVLLARAPAPLRRKVEVAFRGPRGLTIHLGAGPSAYFGSGERMTAKWASLTAVLASPSSRGATAIDVRVPEHPAAAGLEQASTQQDQASTGA
jgi:cell division protein FtsQ